VDDKKRNLAKGTLRPLLCFAARIHALIEHRVALANLPSIPFYGRKRKGLDCVPLIQFAQHATDKRDYR